MRIILTGQFMQKLKLLIGICILSLSLQTTAQDSSKLETNTIVPSDYFETVSKKADYLERLLDKRSQKVLIRMQKAELKMKKKLAKIDSLAANNMLSDAESKYKQLEEQLKNSKALSQYIPRLDTVATSLKFLDQHPQWLGGTIAAKEKLDNAISKVKELETQLQRAEHIKQFLRERRQYLREQLQKLGLTKELKKINKELFYYAESLKEIRAIIQDPKKIERKAIELLSKTKLFQDFMRKNSLFASLFRMPGDPNDANYIASLAGLQTRAQVNGLIQNQVAVGGSGAQQQFSQNLQAAQSELQQLKDKINKLGGGGSSDDIMPEGFRSNNEKAKRFWNRFELGTNIQIQKATNVFPVRSDFGLSMGYRLNNRSIIGGGIIWSMGWGSGWNNIRITHQGIGLRTFIDWKVKASLLITGGYEQNYKTEIRSVVQLQDHSAWQQSGLIGLSKVVSVKSKLFKKTKVQILWDFLSYSQIPKGQPIVFRIGYSFK